MRTIELQASIWCVVKEEKMSTSNNLASERKRLGMTQANAAKELRVSTKTLAKYEGNPLLMPGDFIVRAARFYGCSANYLLGISGERLGSVAV